VIQLDEAVGHGVRDVIPRYDADPVATFAHDDLLQSVDDDGDDRSAASANPAIDRMADACASLDTFYNAAPIRRP
jgi:hypothetical protein